MSTDDFLLYKCDVTLRIKGEFPVANDNDEYLANATGCIVTLFIKKLHIKEVLELVSFECENVFSNDGVEVRIDHVEDLKVELINYKDLDVNLDKGVNLANDLLHKSGIIFFVHNEGMSFFDKVKNFFN